MGRFCSYRCGGFGKTRSIVHPKWQLVPTLVFEYPEDANQKILVFKVNEIFGSTNGVDWTEEMTKAIRLMILKLLSNIQKNEKITIGIENSTSKIFSRSLNCKDVRRHCSKIMAEYIAKHTSEHNILNEVFYLTLNQ